ncbi:MULTISPECIES: monovalent cation/H(+) antiporter subunit G [Ruegeria]|uniref:monovalent cation/H(+) antiporter subunit G n=1 Tax=Ruegeria TaxID=97050 RepID=UPI00147DF9E5|nr:MULTISPECIES: monovalent cation/H(+) antiporter subunit G [Ruegeria]MBY6082773.1 monovalent cation/H(+) antiporter subunit G [Ruegeria arenilitoris]UWR08382.1 monovalent cation/H(+) antiporter subunit G [Ruegeria sp. B32]
MTTSSMLALPLLLIGVCFFFAGTVGMLRLPDIFTRLHALTKADNVGLGFIVAGLAVMSGQFLIALKLVLIWGLVLVSAATTAHLIAQSAVRKGAKPWKR